MVLIFMNSKCYVNKVLTTVTYPKAPLCGDLNASFPKRSLKSSDEGLILDRHRPAPTTGCRHSCPRQQRKRIKSGGGMKS